MVLGLGDLATEAVHADTPPGAGLKVDTVDLEGDAFEVDSGEHRFAPGAEHDVAVGVGGVGHGDDVRLSVDRHGDAPDLLLQEEVATGVGVELDELMVLAGHGDASSLMSISRPRERRRPGGWTRPLAGPIQASADQLPQGRAEGPERTRLAVTPIVSRSGNGHLRSQP